ncbi:hypothetical protein BKI52_38640 [marine bacterium AO1-C]|nr:hypothetical protein BKI52_38640 [marine bacterium AO1-C]
MEVNTMDKKIIFLGLILGLMSQVTLAQSKAKKIKQIIGWGKYTQDQKQAQKFFVKQYNLQRKLTKEQDFRLYVDNTYHYNKRGKLQRVDGYEGETSFTIKYKYGRNVITKQLETPDGKKSNTHIYYNKKGKIVEKKMYDARKLYKRIVYNYNRRDSLIGEMHYIYTGKNRRNYKVIYTYDTKTKKRLRRNEYDSNKQIIEKVVYQYNNQGNLKSISKEFPQRKNSDYNTTIVYKYKNGQLWQIINKSNNNQYESRKIYKNGILIRTRKYENEKLTELIDYQYIYY